MENLIIEKTKTKHEVTDKTTLEVLESLYQLYTVCGIVRNYSGVVETSVAEMRGGKLSMMNLMLCFIKNINKHLTFPTMAGWKTNQRFLLIRNEFLPAEYSYNEWKKHDEFQEYLEHKLLTTHVRKIITTPETKTVTLSQRDKEFIMNIKKEFDYDTIDDAVLHVLERSTGWRLISFISRLLHDAVTLREIEEITHSFGGFIFLVGHEKQGEDKIKLVAEFYPFIYNIDFAIISEVEVNVRAK